MKFMPLASRAICALIVILATGCSGSSVRKDDSPVLARVGKAELTRADLAKALPIGLNSSDSARYASSYIRRWISGKLISDIASSEIEMGEIDRMVNDYRNRLIEMEYRRLMADAHAVTEFPEDSLRSFYHSNSSDFILERPMLQGIYLKVPDNAPNLKLIRRLYRSDSQADIDRLEKEVLESAIHYDYFRDKWIDWAQIETHIPFDFGPRPDAFLRGRDHFETTAGGFVYLLDITDVLPSGSVMPFDNAKVLINERLSALERRNYDARLMANLYDKSLSDGKIQLFVDLEP